MTRDQKYSISFVDYGTVTVVEKSQLRHLPNEFITFLPKLAIPAQIEGADDLTHGGAKVYIYKNKANTVIAL